MFYERVFRALNRARVRYLVVGGVAVALHGSDRLTADLDIMVDMGEENLTRLVAALARLGFRPVVPVKIEDFVSAENRRRWQREKGMLVFGLTNVKNPLMSVDIMLDNPVDFKSAYLRRVVARIEDLRIPLAGSADLIRMKMESSRVQDLDDIAFLKAADRARRSGR